MQHFLLQSAQSGPMFALLHRRKQFLQTVILYSRILTHLFCSLMTRYKHKEMQIPATSLKSTPAFDDLATCWVLFQDESLFGWNRKFR